MKFAPDIIVCAAIFLTSSMVSLIYYVIKLAKLDVSKPLSSWSQIAKYLVLYVIFEIGFLIQEPFTYMIYVEDGLRTIEIAIILSFRIIIPTIVNFVQQHLVAYLSPRVILAMASTFASAGSLVCLLSSFGYYCLGSILTTTGKSLAQTFLKDWTFGNVEKDENTNNFVHVLRNIISIVVVCFVSTAAYFISNTIGVHQVFYVISGSYFACIPISFLVAKGSTMPTQPSKGRPIPINGQIVCTGIYLFEGLFVSHLPLIIGLDKTGEFFALFYGALETASLLGEYFISKASGSPYVAMFIASMVLTCSSVITSQLIESNISIASLVVVKGALAALKQAVGYITRYPYNELLFSGAAAFQVVLLHSSPGDLMVLLCCLYSVVSNIGLMHIVYPTPMDP